MLSKSTVPHSAFTFADEVAIFLHKSQLFIILVVYSFVFGKFVHSEMVNHLSELLFAQLFPKKFSHFENFSREIPFQIFVKEEEHVRMVSLGPGVQQVWEVR